MHGLNGVEYGLVPAERRPAARTSTTAWRGSRSRGGGGFGEFAARLDNKMLETVPEEVLARERLRRLSIARNRILALTPDIKRLIHLTYLNVSSNGLKTLPNELASLVYLHDVRATDNNFSRVPDALLLLPRLRVMDVRENPLNEAIQIDASERGGATTQLKFINDVFATQKRRRPGPDDARRIEAVTATLLPILRNALQGEHKRALDEALRLATASQVVAKLRTARLQCTSSTSLATSIDEARTIGGDAQEIEKAENVYATVTRIDAAVHAHDADSLRTSLDQIRALQASGDVDSTAMERSPNLNRAANTLKTLMSQRKFEEWKRQKRDANLLSRAGTSSSSYSHFLLRSPDLCSRSSSTLPATSRRTYNESEDDEMSTSGDGSLSLEASRLALLRPMTSMALRHKKSFSDWAAEKKAKAKAQRALMDTIRVEEKKRRCSQRDMQRADLYSKMRLEVQWRDRSRW